MVYLADQEDWIQREVITETGQSLGWVRRLNVDADTQVLISLVVVPSSIRWLPEELVGADAISGDEVVSSGPGKLIVFEDAERRVSHLKVGLLERLGMAHLLRMFEKDATITLPIGPAEQHSYWEDVDSDDVWVEPVEKHSYWKDDDPDDDVGFQPATKPRNPNPKPTDDAAEIPRE